MRSLDQVSYCPDFLFKACRLRLITCRPVQPITDSVTKIPQADLRCSGGFLGVFLDCSDFSAGAGPASPESPLLWHLGQFLSGPGSDVIHRFKRDCQCSYFNCVSTSRVSIPAICWSLLFPDFFLSEDTGRFHFCQNKTMPVKDILWGNSALKSLKSTLPVLYILLICVLGFSDNSNQENSTRLVKLIVFFIWLPVHVSERD